jgi:assimilatory nitrate reductase electron transfer subunit
VVAATVNARQAVVVGGGLLGLEAAVGLLQRGLAVTLVHHRDHLLDRQLDPPAAAVLAAAADDLGLRLVVGSRPTAVTTRSGRVTGVSLDGGPDAEGGWLAADVLLLACGTRPEIALAAGAGLPTDRGVLVTADLRSPDDTCVAAIGDCAQPPEGGTGLVAQGWDQARRLARSLAHGPSCPAEASGEVEVPGEVVRLKAKGLDVVTMGAPDVPGARTVTLDDPAGRRHLRVSVRGDRLVGATCVGAGDLAADLLAAFDRGTPVPLDPAALLVRSAVAAPVETSPTLLPARATVCRCNGVTKGDLVQAWEEGAGTVAEVAACTRATTGCGGCRDAVCGIVDWLSTVEPVETAEPNEEVAAA